MLHLLLDRDQHQQAVTFILQDSLSQSQIAAGRTKTEPSGDWSYHD